LSTNREIIESVLHIDHNAAAVSSEMRHAEQQIAELSKKTVASQSLIQSSRTEMAFYESEARRLYHKVSALDEKRSQRTEKLTHVKNDEEHRFLKRDIEHVERELREAQRKIDDLESSLERHKQALKASKKELVVIFAATEQERNRAEEARQNSSGKLAEIEKVRESYLESLDERLKQHYLRVCKVTRNPQGPISHLNNRACGNCFIELSPFILSNLSKKDVVEICPSCYHLLIP